MFYLSSQPSQSKARTEQPDTEAKQQEPKETFNGSILAPIGNGSDLLKATNELETYERELMENWQTLFFDELKNAWANWPAQAAPVEPQWLPLFPTVGLPRFSFYTAETSDKPEY